MVHVNNSLVENSAGLRCACFLTCVGSKIKTAGDDCINKKVLYKNFDMGKRSRWFEDHCADPNIRVLARLLCDMRVRFKVFFDNYNHISIVFN